MRPLLTLLPVLLVLPALPALAECPAQDAAALAAERAPYFEALKAAPDETQGREAADLIWRSWHRAPDARAQALLDSGTARIREADHAEAERLLSELVAYCPSYPEGWNQRAFGRFLSGDLDGALEDLDRTLALEPRHFAALAGRALTLLKQGRVEPAQRALRQAVAINPWISERHLLVEPPGRKA